MPWAFSAVILLFISCATGGKGPASQAAPSAPAAARTFLRSEPGPKPDWTDTTPKNNAELYFIGVSGGYAEATEARGAARENAFNQILKYYGEFIQAGGTTHTSAAGLSSETLDPYIVREEEIARFAQAIVQQVAADKYYTEIYDVGGKEEYIVYVLCQMPKAKAEADIQNFAKNISEGYTNLFAAQNNLVTALKLYADVYRQLQQNPLHRAAAYYDSPGGRVGLFDYCGVQINAIANSVSFATVPPQSAQKGQTLNTTISVSSTMFRSIGPADCMVIINDSKNAFPDAKFTVGQDNSFLLQIHTNRIDPGKYTVQLELRLNEAASGVQRNPRSAFGFELTPLNSAKVVLLDQASDGIAGKVRQIIQDNGLLLVDRDAAYLVTIKFDANETQTANYVNVQPAVTITVELERDGTPLVTYTKIYPQFRHVTRTEAYNRAYRNIENDLEGEFAGKLRGIEK